MSDENVISFADRIKNGARLDNQRQAAVKTGDEGPPRQGFPLYHIFLKNIGDSTGLPGYVEVRGVLGAFPGYVCVAAAQGEIQFLTTSDNFLSAEIVEEEEEVIAELIQDAEFEELDGDVDGNR